MEQEQDEDLPYFIEFTEPNMNETKFDEDL